MRGQEDRSGSSARRGSTRRKPDPAAYGSDVVKWRRIALEKQLPRPSFPAGLRAPSLVCTWMLLALAVVSFVYLGFQGGDRVPQAVIDSQERLVRSLARSLQAAVTTGAEQLEDAGENYAGAADRDPAALLETTVAGRTRWSGLAIVRANTREPVAVRGEPVPTELIPQSVTRTTVAAVPRGSEPAVLIVAPLPDGQLLAGTTVLQVRRLKLGAAGQQTVLVGRDNGEYAAVQGAGIPKQSPLERPVREAIAAAARGDVTSLTQPVDRRTDVSVPSPSVAVIVAAPVGEAGIAVASTVLAPVVDGGPRWQGAAPAAGLVVAAGLAYLIVHFGLVRPVRRLLAAAQAAACGDGRPQAPLTTPWEVRRIYYALHPADAPPRRRGRRGLTVVAALVTATLILLSWPAAVMAAVGHTVVEVPDQVVVDAENQTTATAAAVGDALDRGLTQVKEVAARVGTDAVADRRALQRLNRTESRYRSLYVSDAKGSPELVVGRQPLRRSTPVADNGGVALDNTSGRLPVVYAYARGADGRAVVGEFDVAYLAGVLHRVSGRGRVVDSELRVILDTEGYRAFEPLVDEAQRASTAAAVVGKTSAAVTRTRLVSTAPLATPSYIGGLRWTVVAEWPVADLDLPPNTRWRITLTMAGIALAIALTMFGWHYFVLVGPLRRLVAAADNLADGDHGTVISPHRHDEIGAVAACLEICRQVRAYGTQRLGGAVRLRGWLDGYTTVLPQITPDLTEAHRSSRKS